MEDRTTEYVQKGLKGLNNIKKYQKRINAVTSDDIQKKQSECKRKTQDGMNC